MRVGVTLECQECKNRNYRTTKNRHTTTDRLEIKKHCSTCRRHTTHRETR